MPIAPELGLLLDECLYESYNAQWAETHAPLGLAAYAQQAGDFKVGGWVYVWVWVRVGSPEAGHAGSQG